MDYVDWRDLGRGGKRGVFYFIFFYFFLFLNNHITPRRAYCHGRGKREAKLFSDFPVLYLAAKRCG